MKKALAILVTLASVSAGAMTSPRLDPNSFTSLVMSAKRTHLQDELGAKCVAVLKAKRAVVRAQALEPYLIPIKSIPFQATADGLFFHYTDNQTTIERVRAKNYAPIFNDLRKDGDDPFLYVASDDHSSVMFGFNQVRIHISPEENIFMPMRPAVYADAIAHKDLSMYGFQKVTPTDDPVYKETALVSKDLVAQLVLDNPSLAPCADKNASGWDDGNILILLALENARVPLAAYYGTMIGWFHVMGTWAIDSAEVGSLPTNF